MWMERQCSAPRVECRDHTGLRSEVSGVSQEFEERLSDSAKEVIGEPLAVELPELEEVVGQCEDDVVVVTREEAGPPSVEPAIDL